MKRSKQIFNDSDLANNKMKKDNRNRRNKDKKYKEKNDKRNKIKKKHL